jgi:hypothetical protein
MDTLSLIIAIVLALIGLDVAALTAGADSREAIGDDHAR